MAESVQFPEIPNQDPDNNEKMLILTKEGNLVYRPMTESVKADFANRTARNFWRVVQKYISIESDFNNFNMRNRLYRYPNDRGDQVDFEANDGTQWVLWKMGARLFDEMVRIGKKQEAVEMMSSFQLKPTWFGKKWQNEAA